MNTLPPPLNLPSAEPVWKQRCWKYTALFISVVSVQGFGVVSVIPRFEKVFEDMLGDRNKLPMLTQWVILWSHHQQNFILLQLLLLPILAALLWITKAHVVVRVIFAVIMTALTMHVLAAIPAIALPYRQLISSLAQ